MFFFSCCLRRHTARHRAGLCVLSLLLLAESVTVANAVSFWTWTATLTATASSSSVAAASAVQQHQQEQQQQQCSSAKEELSPSGECIVAAAHAHVDADPCATCPASCLCPTPATLVRGGASVVSSPPPPFHWSLTTWKAVLQTFLTTLNVACWYLPLQSATVIDNPTALAHANAFSGGVFLTLAFGHLIPEAVATWPVAGSSPFLWVVAGYLLIFLVEKVLFDAHGALHSMQEGGGGGGKNDPSHSHSNGSHGVIAKNSSPRGAVVLLGALAVHSVLEMMALGLADNFRDAALLTASIALHQPAESLALLVAFCKSGLSKRTIVTYLAVFSATGPVGCALGVAVNTYVQSPLLDAALLAVVAGTFVYVGATEVVPEEFADGQERWTRGAALLTGVGTILAVTSFTQGMGGHEHATAAGH